jgi:hypothetical protein
MMSRTHSWVGAVTCAALVVMTGIAPATPPHALDRSVTNDAFGVGEWLKFSIGYGFIDAGDAVMEIREVVDINNRPVYRIVSTATSNRLFDAVYRVRDTMRTWMDVEGLFSWRFEKRTHEGDYQQVQTVLFDQERGVAVSGQDTTEVPPYIQDVMAAFYYIRSQPLQVGDTLVVPHFSEGKQYDLGVIVHEQERIETPAGEFDCIKVEPLLRAEGMFRQEGRVFIWLTDDRLHMPVLVRSKLSVGSIRAELTGYRIGELWEE